jgi:hypothetical protein
VGPPVGGAGFLVRPGDRVKWKVVPLERGTAQPWDEALGETAVGILGSEVRLLSLPWASEGPLVPTLCPRRRPFPKGGVRRGMGTLRIPEREARHFRSKVRFRHRGVNSGPQRGFWPREPERRSRSRRDRPPKWSQNGGQGSPLTERRSRPAGLRFESSQWIYDNAWQALARV